jgi:UDP-N-acetylmuramate: L-alanyl-gamma-D-glutamyl-meso-diaminopimelate ligase
MAIDLQQIKDKQRIAIIGNEGTNEITKIVMHILDSVNKPYDHINLDEAHKISDASIVIIQGNFSKMTQAGYEEFLKFKHHIALIHHVEDENSRNFNSIEEFIDKYETFADNTPKSGTLLYNKEDNLAMVIGEKQREGVGLFEYESLPGNPIENGFCIDGKLNVLSGNTNFLSHAGATKSLLRLISISEEQIMNGFSTYKD